MLANTRGQLIVTPDDVGLMPNGIAVHADEFELVRTAARAGGLDLSHWMPDVIAAVDLRIGAASIDSAAVGILRSESELGEPSGPFDPSWQRAAADALAESVLAGSINAPLLRRLVGAGPGSTPAGDDVIVGVLAGLRATAHHAAAASFGAAILPLLSRTTSTSQHFLVAAVDGRFAERVHQLVRALGSPISAAETARAAANWGATSGHDLLAGLVATVQAAAAQPTHHQRTA